MNIRRAPARPARLLHHALSALALATVSALSVVTVACSSSSNEASTGASVKPAILAQPASISVQKGKGFALSVSATGKPAVAFQWTKDGAALAGATQATYTVAAAAASDAGSYAVQVSNSAGSVTSDAAKVTVIDGPAITTQPTGTTVEAGQPVSLTVAASGTTPLTYQWAKDGTAVAGATSATFTLAAAAVSDAGSYTVTVSNLLGSTTSQAAVVQVLPALGAAALANQSVTDGAPASFTVVAAGGKAPYAYQWFRGTTALTGATAATYAIPATVYGTDNGAQFSCTVTDALNRTVTTNAATLTVVPVAPVFTTQPATTTVSVGQQVTLTAAATGTAPITYQWFLGGNAVAGATSPTYTIASAAVAHAGTYTVKATNPATTVTSAAAVLTVNPALTVSAPASQSVTDGATATFSVTATGVAPLTYQWYQNGTILAGANAASYTTAATVWATDNGAQFTCVVGDALTRTVTSAAATLVVVPIAPAIGTQPVSQTVDEGTSVSFTVTATGTAPLSYQWYNGATAITGATSATYTLATPAVADAGSLTVVVTNGAGQTVTSSAAILTVNAVPTPVITVQPAANTVVTAPDGATFSVTATGNGLSYQWYKNSAVITGATSATYTVTATDLSATADQYFVKVSNAAGHVDSNTATLAVAPPKPVYAGDPTSATPGTYTVWSSFYTTAPADTTLGSFRFGYDTAKLNPLFSAACFFPSVQVSNASRPGTYPDDTRVPGSLTSSDYSNTGWSRGHQTGFADLRDHYGTEAGQSSMYMTNMCPQDQPFNGGPWQTFEDLVTTTLPAAYGRVWVYTGPIFGEQIVPPIGTKNIPVPNAFYKIMVRETAPGVPVVLATILPNSSTIDKPYADMTDKDFWKFTTTVDRVQELTGLTFFPAPATALPAGFTSTVDVTNWGSYFRQGPNKPNVHMIQPSWDTEYRHQHNSNNTWTTIDTTTALTGATVTFKALAAPDPDPIASVEWDFNDGTKASTANATHAFAAAGDYKVSFTATDNAGHTSTITRVVTIKDPVNYPPAFNPTTLYNITVPYGTTTAKQTFTFTDDATAANLITVSATSDNQALVTDAGISKTWNTTLTKWVLTVNLVGGQSGTATITVTGTDAGGKATSTTFTVTVLPSGAHVFYETFETGTKTSYTAGTVTCSAGDWTMTDALIGTSASDPMIGLQSVRIRNATTAPSGKLTMKADYAYGAQTVTVMSARYGSNTLGTWALFYSTDAGATWTQAGSIVAPASTTLVPSTFTINVNQPIRFEIRKMDANKDERVNIDDFRIDGY